MWPEPIIVLVIIIGAAVLIQVLVLSSDCRPRFFVHLGVTAVIFLCLLTWILYAYNADSPVVGVYYYPIKTVDVPVGSAFGKFQIVDFGNGKWAPTGSTVIYPDGWCYKKVVYDWHRAGLVFNPEGYVEWSVGPCPQPNYIERQ